MNFECYTWIVKGEENLITVLLFSAHYDEEKGTLSAGV